MKIAWRPPLVLTLILIAGFAAHFPADVRNAATLAWASQFHLVFPAWHLALTPLCTAADFLTTLSVHQSACLVGWLVAGFFILLGWKRGAIAVLAFILFVAWGALVPRPMARLVADDPDTILIDFHSHTRYSHDGRTSFTPAANRRWHALQGFNAGFITDHNRVEGSLESEQASDESWMTTHYLSLEGEEISLAKTHLVLLCNTERVDNRPYDSDVRKIEQFVHDMHERHLPVIASLPEYWLYHWGPGVDDFVKWGMDGFEIVNSAPKALDFPLKDREFIVELCREHHLLFTGISDNHGYGYATDAWNAMDLPGWRSWSPPQLQEEIRKRFIDPSIDRSTLVEVLERPHVFPASRLALFFSAWANAWLYLRELSALQVLIWLGWVWAAAIARSFFVYG